MIDNKQPSVLASLDWWTIGIYLVLLIFGWVSVCGASYNYGDNEIFSLGARSGMQIIWIGTSIALGLVILLLDDRFYDTFSYVIYGVLILLLFATIFNPHSIKGSHSWLVLGPLRLQPAEFGKFATALAFQYAEPEAFHGSRRHYRSADALYRRSARNGFCPGLSFILPHALPRRNAGCHSLYRRVDGGLLRSGCEV